MKDSFLTVQEYAQMFETTKASVYVLISLNKNRCPQYFKKDNNRTYIHSSFKNRNSIDINRRNYLESLYFEAVEIYDSDNNLSLLMSDGDKKLYRRIYERLRAFTFTTTDVAEDMIERFEILLNKRSVA